MADSAAIDWENLDVSDIKLCRIDNPNCESCAG
jgi:hypothetical protein